MELKQLQFLVVCAQTQSFSKASGILFTAQSNVSKVIRSLEEELGVELFERKQYGIALTPRGRQVYEYARTTLESAEKISEYAKQEIREELRISCNPSSWMARTFRKYYQEKGRVDVGYHIMTAGSDDIVKRLAADVDQLGFIYIPEAQLTLRQNAFARNHIIFSPLKKIIPMLYFGNAKALEKYLDASDEEKELRLVQGYEDEYTLHAFEKDIEGVHGRIDRHVAVTTNSDLIMSELLEYTDLGNLSWAYLSGAQEGAERHSISLEDEDNPVLFGVLFRNDRELGKLQLEYVNYVKKMIRED